MSDDQDHQASAAVLDYGGDLYMKDANGKLVPLELVKAADKLEDELVRALVAKAKATRDVIIATRDGAFQDVADFVEQVALDYGLRKGGVNGNVELKSYDGTMKVELQVQKRVAYGPELQIAKEIVDECLKRWGTGSAPEIRAIVADAFNVDNKGQVNRNSLLRLKRLDIEDERWLEAMRAIGDAETPDGTKAYIRFHERESAKDKRWNHISLDAATA